MTLVAPIDLRPWYRDVNRALGFQTATTAPEPVHVLNGFLYRQIRFDTHPTALATQLVAQKKNRWIREDLSALRAEAASAGLHLPDDDLELEVLRQKIRAVFAADMAVFPSAQSYQVAHLGMVTDDRAEANIGRFGASLLMNLAEGPAAIQSLVERLMQPQSNPVWALEAATVGSSFTATVAEPLDVPPWAEDGLGATLSRDLGDLLLRATTLAAQGLDTLEGLRTLALTTTWASVLAFAQVPSLMVDRRLQPIPLVVASAEGCPALRDASHQALNSVAQAFRRWIGEMLAKRVLDDFGGEPSESEARDWVQSAIPFKPSAAAEKTRAGLSRVFDDARHSATVSVAAAQALLTFLEATMNAPAMDWFSSTGRACGFVYPRRGNVRRRFCVEFQLVPSLVMAGFENDEERLSFDDWAGRIRSRFGLLIAEASSQDLSLRPRPSDGEWANNRSAMIELLQRVGLAEAYSDQVAEVLNPLAIWRKGRAVV